MRDTHHQGFTPETFKFRDISAMSFPDIESEIFELVTEIKRREKVCNFSREAHKYLQ